MKFLVGMARGLCAVLLCASLSGCLPQASGENDEERESHYLAGKSCLNTMDFQGAVESFEQAAEINPRSSAAHFQLGCLYEEKQKDPAAAIYHYEQYLKLQPASDKAEYVRQRINNCKQDLARLVLPLPLPAGMQRSFEKLTDENQRLLKENERLRAQLAAQPATLGAEAPAPIRPAPPGITTDRPSGGKPRPPETSTAVVAPSAGRRHLVQRGETLTAISRKYGVKLEDLLRANPGLEPRRMRSGSSLNIPSH